MKIGILCAVDRELDPFPAVMEDQHVTEQAMLRIMEGRIGNLDIAAVRSGVCKVNAAIAAQVLIDACRPDVILNSGTAGAMDPSLRLFDVVIASEIAYHDVGAHILTEYHPWMESEFA